MQTLPESRQQFVTTKNAARALGLSVSRVHHLLREGRLHGEKWGRDWQVSVESIATYRQSRRRYVKKYRKAKG